MPEPYADTLATVATGRTAFVARLRAVVVGEEHESSAIESAQDDEAAGRLASRALGGDDHRVGIAVRHREPRVRPPAFESIERVGSAPATSKVSDGSGAVTPLRTTRTLPGERTRIEAPCTG